MSSIVARRRLEVCGNNIMIPIYTHSYDFSPIPILIDNQDSVCTGT